MTTLPVRWQQLDQWIFDMDGTLTLCVHDFDAIREEMAVPAGQPILEYLDTLPSEQAAPLHQQLLEIERRHVALTQVADGARELLTDLKANGCRLGIVTRNARQIALETLDQCELWDFFDEHTVVARECAVPKPDPAGLNKLLNHWQGRADKTAMVGDYVHDLQAGRAAGAATVYVNIKQDARWIPMADLTVPGLKELHEVVKT